MLISLEKGFLAKLDTKDIGNGVGIFEHLSIFSGKRYILEHWTDLLRDIFQDWF